MAERVVKTLVDDIDGSEAVVSREFALDGRRFRIDLSQSNSEQLDRVLKRFIAAAREEKQSVSRRSKRAPRASAPGKVDIAELRAWAARNKVEIPARGRIPVAVVERFRLESGLSTSPASPASDTSDASSDSVPPQAARATKAGARSKAGSASRSAASSSRKPSSKMPGRGSASAASSRSGGAKKASRRVGSGGSPAGSELSAPQS